MSQPKPFSGKDLRVMLKSSAADANPKYLCNIKTSQLQETWEFDDATTPNCDSPGKVAARSSVKKLYSWSCNVSGICDAKNYQTVRTVANGDSPAFLQFLLAKAAADGGGHFDGAAWFENLTVSYDDLGIVKFSGQLRGEGELTWTDAAA